MNVLAMHTTGAEASVALVEIRPESAKTVALRTLTRRSGAAEMVPAIAELLAEAGWSKKHIEGIALASGPGSFTGIRNGLATMKGWATATGTPVVMLSSLAVLASEMERGCSLLDAGRGEFYVGRYAAWGQEKIAEALVGPEALAAVLEDAGAIVVCEESVAEVLRVAGRKFIEVSAPDAGSVARVTSARFLRGETDAWELADGNYLRRPEAQVKLEEKAARL
jgi:tRNA threonylcarbamoyladenosine biosynthesis protein TsaB